MKRRKGEDKDKRTLFANVVKTFLLLLGANLVFSWDASIAVKASESLKIRVPKRLLLNFWTFTQILWTAQPLWHYRNFSFLTKGLNLRAKIPEFLLFKILIFALNHGSFYKGFEVLYFMLLWIECAFGEIFAKGLQVHVHRSAAFRAAVAQAPANLRPTRQRIILH